MPWCPATARGNRPKSHLRWLRRSVPPWRPRPPRSGTECQPTGIHGCSKRFCGIGTASPCRGGPPQVAPSATGPVVITKADKSTADTFQVFLGTPLAIFPEKAIHSKFSTPRSSHPTWRTISNSICAFYHRTPRTSITPNDYGNSCANKSSSTQFSQSRGDSDDHRPRSPISDRGAG